MWRTKSLAIAIQPASFSVRSNVMGLSLIHI